MRSLMNLLGVITPIPVLGWLATAVVWIVGLVSLVFLFTDPEHRTVRDLSTLVGPGDLLVVNETRVRPARLHLHKQSGGAVEVLLLEPEHERTWSALVRPGRRVQ